MSDLGDMIGRTVIAGAIVLCAIAFALGSLAMWAIPKLWHWLIPIIHRATA